jgi:hypothetical protein
MPDDPHPRDFLVEENPALKSGGTAALGEKAQ